MTDSLRLALICALVALPSGARAQAALRLDGTCQRLVVAGEDLTGACAGILTNAVERGRTRFDFATRDGRTLSFGGSGAQQEATEETDPLQPISRVQTGGPAGGDLAPAVGACRFSSPQPGRTAITCEARAADGRTFAGTFVTAAKDANGETGEGAGKGAPPAR